MSAEQGYFAEVPRAVVPVYTTAKVNEPVELYEGEMELEWDGQSFKGRGSVRLDWLPRPQLRFTFESPDLSSMPNLGPAKLRLTHLQSEADVNVLHGHVRFLADSEVPWVLGSLSRRFELGTGSELDHIVFHVVNFHDYTGGAIRDENENAFRTGRALTEADGWEIILDNAPNLGDLTASLKGLGGYAITHVGQLRRVDGKSFSATDAEQVLACLPWFLSFCRGFWVSPVLVVGFAPDGSRAWERWEIARVRRWRQARSWFNEYSPEGLAKLFPGYFSRWRAQSWGEPMKLAVHWYCEANMAAGGTEGSIILAQAAFELLAWTLLVEDRKVLSRVGFEKLPAMDKLRLLISACEIPIAIPAQLQDLQAFASGQEDAKDGPGTLTAIRNALVHSNPQKRQRVPAKSSGEITEARDLSQWFLELVLLRLCGYEGHYSNRLMRKIYKGQEVERVPWSTEARAETVIDPPAS